MIVIYGIENLYEIRMDLRQLRYFLEIVEQGSLTAASRSLNVAQPALSLHLRNMEEQLNTKLLIRKTNGVEPTDAGELLRARARSILNDMARTKDEIRNLDKSPGGAVRLGLPGTISEIITLPLMEALVERYPRITLNVAEAMSGFVTGWLDEGRVDLAVLYASSFDHKSKDNKIVEEELVLIEAPVRSAAETVSFRVLSDKRLILPSKGHGLRDLVDGFAQGVGVQSEVAMEIDSYRNIKHLVCRGFGASILPLHAVTEEVANGTLSCARFVDPGLRRSAVIKRAGTVTRAQQAVEETIHEVVGRLVKDGLWVGASLTES